MVSIFRRYVGWACLVLVLCATSISIPIFSRQDPAKGSVTNPRLFPFYYQTNADAPMELATALGFPGILRTMPYRINRPTEYAVLAAVRGLLIKPILGILWKKDGTQAMWGQWPARDYLCTYAIWMAMNLALILAAAALYHGMVKLQFGSLHATLAAILMLSSPIVVLSLREVHNGPFHIFGGVATFAFWHAVLVNRISTGRIIGLALGMGLLYLGKPCLNSFATGLLLCLWLGQGRKLFFILPAVALPTLVWMLVVRSVGLHYTVSDVSTFGAGVWIFQMGSPTGLLRETWMFLSSWSRVLGEDLYAPVLVLAVLGAWSFWRNGRRPFLWLALFSVGVDMAFYFLLHRVNAVYGMNTLILFFVLAAEGMVAAIRGMSDWLASSRRIRLGAPAQAVLCVLLTLALQLALNFRQLPLYGG